MNNLYLIVGRSGSGKTTIVEELERRYGYKAVQSYTTRKPRYEGETGHTFVSKEEFDKHDMIAYTMFDNNEYGVDAELLKGSDLYVIDIPGVHVLKNKYKDKRLITINIRCDKSKLIDRMLVRGDSEEKIKNRIINDDRMFAEESTFDFDYVINNNSAIENIVNKINKIIEKEEKTDIPYNTIV